MDSGLFAAFACLRNTSKSEESPGETMETQFEGKTHTEGGTQTEVIYCRGGAGNRGGGLVETTNTELFSKVNFDNPGTDELMDRVETVLGQQRQLRDSVNYIETNTTGERLAILNKVKPAHFNEAVDRMSSATAAAETALKGVKDKWPSLARKKTTSADDAAAKAKREKKPDYQWIYVFSVVAVSAVILTFALRPSPRKVPVFTHGSSQR